eukprot:snap_masked-scaffold_1-processed-gene-8.41-mRNA-1 protein AED:1.00 eAED:1.00 QI:0/0/0/0/1/1/2/0/93
MRETTSKDLLDLTQLEKSYYMLVMGLELLKLLSNLAQDVLYGELTQLQITISIELHVYMVLNIENYFFVEGFLCTTMRSSESPSKRLPLYLIG